jgi:hypothetical protein
MIIFDKFGDGQSERNRSAPVFPNNLMRIVTRVSGSCLLALTKEGTKERHRSRMSERFSHPALAAPHDVSMHGRIPISLREPRVSSHERRTPISNRELDLLERHLSRCKQRKATVSNRELSTVRSFDVPSALGRDQLALSLRGPRIAGRGSRPLTTFLPGSGQKVEVTEKKRLNHVYPALEMHVGAVQFRAEFQLESQTRSEKESGSRDAAEQGKLPLTIPTEKELS